MHVFKPSHSRFYRGRYRLSDGPRWYDVPLRVEQKHVAEAKLRALVREIEEERAGLLGPKALREAARAPLEQHCADFLADLTARNRGKAHLVHVKSRLARLLADCKWKVIPDMTADSFLRWRERNADFSTKTRNEYLGHATALLNWLVRQGRAVSNPLKAVGKLPRKDTFRRRALAPDQLKALVAVSGRRGLRYLFAGCTGLRRGEMSKLLWDDVHLEDAQPYVSLRPEITKNRRAAIVPLLPDLAEALRSEIARKKGVTATAKVFSRGLPSAKTLAADLMACGIPVEDDQGQRVDFHALRHTFVSMLASAGVSELARVKLARHSEWRMTDRYTDPKSVPLFAEMQKLSAALVSQTVSQISGKTGQNESNAVQVGSENLPVENGATDQKKTGLAIADQTRLHPSNGAQGGTRTPTPYGTRTSNVCVYQFHHLSSLKEGRAN